MGGVRIRTKHTLPRICIVVLKQSNNPGYSTNLLLPTWTREYASEDVIPPRCHQSKIMHSTILPELGVIASGLPVDDSRDLGTVNENVARKEVTVSEVDLCIRREMAE